MRQEFAIIILLVILSIVFKENITAVAQGHAEETVDAFEEADAGATRDAPPKTKKKVKVKVKAKPKSNRDASSGSGGTSSSSENRKDDNDTNRSEGVKEDPNAKMQAIVTAVSLVLTVSGLYKYAFSGTNSARSLDFDLPSEIAEYKKAKADALSSLSSSSVSSVPIIQDLGIVEKDNLKKYLVKRAMASVILIQEVHRKAEMTERLYKKGMLNETNSAADFINEEIRDIQIEADLLAPGWSKAILPQAVEFIRRYNAKVAQTQG